MDSFDGRNGRLDHYPDAEQNNSLLKYNKDLFSDDQWQTSDSHRKKELPPLKRNCFNIPKRKPTKAKRTF